MVAASVFAASTRPLWPIDVPPAATTGQACHGTPLGAVATDTCRVGAFQLTSPTSVALLLLPSNGSDRAVHALRLDARGLLQLAREGLLLGRVGDRPDPPQVRVQEPRPRLVDQDLVVPRLDGDLLRDPRHEGRPLCDLAEPRD